jgi:SAM-dependent methyltransferase
VPLPPPSDPFADFKARQAIAWGAAPFERVADTMADIHDRLVESLAPRPGERWLDVATGTGPVALRAARRGARATGVDLAPALVTTARGLAAAEARTVRWAVADCERLPVGDARFDVVVSAVGVIFAPDHAAVAAELARVCRPGGRLGLACWPPESGAARMAELTLSFVPVPPPPAAGNPFDWGRPEHVRARLGHAFELEFLSGTSVHEAPSAEAIWDLYRTAAGPVARLVASLPPPQLGELRRAFVDLVAPHRVGGRIRYPREYLLVLGRRCG